eukprot:gene18624-biopygen5547
MEKAVWIGEQVAGDRTGRTAQSYDSAILPKILADDVKYRAIDRQMMLPWGVSTGTRRNVAERGRTQTPSHILS